MIDILPEAFERDRYNRLPSVETANAGVRRDGRLNEYLAAAAQLFVRYRLHDRFGIALLHHHNTCDDGERMIQYAAVIDGRNALVTQPAIADATADDDVASVWEWSGERYVPLEFTTDPLAKELLRAGDVPVEFLQEFAELTTSSPIGHLLGLAVVERGLYREAAEGERALEHSTFARQNVMLLERTEPGKNIQTSWAFTTVIDENGDIQAATDCTQGCRTECDWVQIDPANGYHNKPHEKHHWPPGTGPG